MFASGNTAMEGFWAAALFWNSDRTSAAASIRIPTVARAATGQRDRPCPGAAAEEVGAVFAPASACVVAGEGRVFDAGARSWPAVEIALSAATVSGDGSSSRSLLS